MAGIRTPEPIAAIKEVMPNIYEELLRNVHILEKNYHDMQDIEFTIQEGELYMLQTRYVWLLFRIFVVFSPYCSQVW